MKKLTKCEKEITKAVFEIAEKYGYKELAFTGTIDPKWYHRHIKSGVVVPGMTIQFYNYEEK